MREVFVMLIKKKVIFVINMQKFITSNNRHLQIKKNGSPSVHATHKLLAGHRSNSIRSLFVLAILRCCKGSKNAFTQANTTLGIKTVLQM